MNWTGGRLQRHSRGGKQSVSQRQKQHFAKARKNATCTPSSPSAYFVPSYLQNKPRPSQPGSVRSPQTQAQLEDYTQTRPLAQRLGTLGKRPMRNDIRDDGKRIKRHQSNAETERVSKTASVHQQHRPSAQIFPRRGEQLVTPVATTHHQYVEPEDRHHLDATISALLQESNWVGVQASQPVPSICSGRNREALGRRRKTSKAVKMKKTGEDASCSPSRNIYGVRHSATLIRLDRREIRVHIGSEALCAASVQEPTPRAELSPGPETGSGAPMIYRPHPDHPETPTAHGYFLIDQGQIERKESAQSPSVGGEETSMLLDDEKLERRTSLIASSSLLLDSPSPTRNMPNPSTRPGSRTLAGQSNLNAVIRAEAIQGFAPDIHVDPVSAAPAARDVDDNELWRRFVFDGLEVREEQGYGSRLTQSLVNPQGSNSDRCTRGSPYTTLSSSGPDRKVLDQTHAVAGEPSFGTKVDPNHGFSCASHVSSGGGLSSSLEVNQSDTLLHPQPQPSTSELYLGIRNERPSKVATGVSGRYRGEVSPPSTALTEAPVDTMFTSIATDLPSQQGQFAPVPRFRTYASKGRGPLQSRNMFKQLLTRQTTK